MISTFKGLEFSGDAVLYNGIGNRLCIMYPTKTGDERAGHILENIAGFPSHLSADDYVICHMDSIPEDRTYRDQWTLDKEHPSFEGVPIRIDHSIPNGRLLPC